MPQNIFIVFLLIIMVTGCTQKSSNHQKKSKAVTIEKQQNNITQLEDNQTTTMPLYAVTASEAKQIAEHIKAAAIDICKGLNNINNGCIFDFQIENPEENIPASPANIFITSEMQSFVQTDAELAILMGHEYAHKILKSDTKNKSTAAFESQADNLGLYITARAGYDISSAPQLWRKIAIPSLNKIFVGTSHPASSERFLNLEKSLTEINRKKNNGAILAPSIKK